MSARAFAIATALALLACGATARRPGSSSATGEGGAGGALAPGSAGSESDCAAPTPALIRLSFGEQVASLRQLLGDELGDTAAVTAELEARSETFPPLGAPDEGPVIDEARLHTSDELAQLAGRYVRDHFEAVTGCDADYGCVRDFVASLAEQAFRRPLSDPELAALWLTVERAEALGAAPPYGAEYGVQAIFESPHFLYRSELGDALVDYELASAVSYFLTGAPPDGPLLDAASNGSLGSEPGLAAQVERLLAKAPAQQHLQQSLSRLLRFDVLQTIVIDPVLYPTFSSELRQDMGVELDYLLAQVMAGGPAAELLTTRKAHINPGLAAIYGVAFPPDEQGFVDVELPGDRAGLLTRAGWLTLGSRPDGPSVMQRGLLVAALLDCNLHELQQEHPLDIEPQALSEAERARDRLADSRCSGCHERVDSYGLALEDFDAIGQRRDVDARAKLPAPAGGAQVSGGAELSRAILPEAFSSCLSERLFDAALAWSGRVDREDACWPAALAAPADASFGQVVQLVLRARAFPASPR